MYGALNAITYQQTHSEGRILDENKNIYVPTKKGIALSTKVIPDILTAIQEGFDMLDNPIPE